MNEPDAPGAGVPEVQMPESPVPEVQLPEAGGLARCDWAEGSDAMRAYHDDEWGRPSRDDRYLFEMLLLEGAQAGLSWSTILGKRGNYRS
jgi:hypothetical protein